MIKVIKQSDLIKKFNIDKNDGDSSFFGHLLKTK